MPQYICRICDNNNGWVSPDNSAKETNRSHFGNFSFAYEEWNFNPLLNLRGWQYGWIEGFKPGIGRRTVPAGIHEVLLYVRRNGHAWAVGRIKACENIMGQVGLPFYTEALAAQANSVGASIVVNLHNTQWAVTPTRANPGMLAYTQINFPNIRFRLSDAVILTNPKQICIDYRRYGALEVNSVNGRAKVWNMVP